GASGGGINDAAGRALAENNLAGMRMEEGYHGGRDKLNEVRPKYAILNIQSEENLGAKNNNKVSDYGKLQAVFGEPMSERSTFPQGDTYGGSVRDGTPLPQTFKDASTRLGMDSGYHEAQMWGGVGVQDVKEFRVPADTSPEVLEKLKATGKPIYVL